MVISLVPSRKSGGGRQQVNLWLCEGQEDRITVVVVHDLSATPHAAEVQRKYLNWWIGNHTYRSVVYLAQSKIKHAIGNIALAKEHHFRDPLFER
ncbi:hypothetical protein pipiens_006038 [Culex pipiens pipiens]|uniref:Uncharacterized protein n=1 Tax=Culex pipiens pipiens TaxID=38569 RepID=A0ABD1DS27_CULPP